MPTCYIMQCLTRNKPKHQITNRSELKQSMHANQKKKKKKKHTGERKLENQRSTTHQPGNEHNRTIHPANLEDRPRNSRICVIITG